MTDNELATVRASLGGLEVEVTAASHVEAEEVFERVWGRRLDEATDMTEALRTRLGGFE